MVSDDYFLHELILVHLPALWQEWREVFVVFGKVVTVSLLLIFVSPWVLREFHGRLRRYFATREGVIRRKGEVITHGHASYLDFIESLDRRHYLFPKLLPRTRFLPYHGGYHPEMLEYFDHHSHKHHLGDYDLQQEPALVSFLSRCPRFLALWLYPVAVLCVSFRSLDIFCFFLAIVVPIASGLALL